MSAYQLRRKGKAMWVDIVRCRSCNASHGENEIAACSHCEKDVCPTCGNVEEADEPGARPSGYHKPCAAWVDGESDVDPTKGQQQ